jgi:hypothetical protein
MIHVKISTTACEIDPSGNPSRIYITASSLKLGGLQTLRHIDDNVIGTAAILSA